MRLFDKGPGAPNQEWTLADTTSTIRSFGFHSPESHGELYRLDKDYFSKRRGRRFAIRSEPFVLSDYLAPPPYPPRLYVLVAQLACGLHQITPIWRGKPPFSIKSTAVAIAPWRKPTVDWADVSTDAELFLVLRLCIERGGRSEVEWDNYVLERERAKDFNSGLGAGYVATST